MAVIYLNNAATSYPKPECVIKAVHENICAVPCEKGRGNMSTERLNRGTAGDEVKAKQLMAQLIGADDGGIYFASGATESANLVISGLDMKNTHVIVSAAEHNCILRPLYNHPDRPDISVVPCDKNGRVCAEGIEKLIRKNTKYLFVNHMSNVTGYIQDMETFGKIASRYGLILLPTAPSRPAAVLLTLNIWE